MALGASNFRTCGAVGPGLEGAVDARVHQPHRRAGIVHEVSARRPAGAVGLLPDAVGVRVRLRLGTAQSFPGRPSVASGRGVQAGRDLRGGHIDRGGVVQAQQDRAEQQRADRRADENRNLLVLGRGADQKAGLQVLRGGAGIRGGDADDAAHRKRRDVVGPARPADDAGRSGR